MEPDAALTAPPEPPIKTLKRAFVIFNEKAGSVTAADREPLIEALTAAGIEEYAMIGPEVITDDLFDRAKEFDVIVVLGGDGTARCAAELAPRKGPPLVLLPGGTLNILPHALYGQKPWREALAAALQRGVVRRLPMGRANEHKFFIAALFGAPTLLARAREAVREGKFLAAWRRLGHYFKRAFSHRVHARPGKGRTRSAEGIGVLLAAFGGRTIEGDDFEWVRLNAKNSIDLARVGIKARNEGWRNDPTVEISRCTSGEIQSSRVFSATLDGEPHTFIGKVRIAYESNGPLVIALEDTD